MNDHKKYPDAAGASAAGLHTPPPGSPLNLGTDGPAAAALRQREPESNSQLAEQEAACERSNERASELY